MRDLVFVGYLLLLILLAFKRPFLFTLIYAYIDIVTPQRLSYFMLNSIPISLVAFALAFFGYIVADDKKDSRFSFRQGLMLLLLIYAGYTTLQAAFPEEALGKWNWVWKGMIFAIFLPLTLRTRVRIEALAVFMILSAATLIISGGIKTLAGGGGYGQLVMQIDANDGLFEGSTMSMVSIAIIPLILWLSKFGTIFPSDWRVRLFSAGLIFACLLIPVGTQARTGLVCMAVLFTLLLRFNRHRFIYAAGAIMIGFISIPFLPQSFTERVQTLENVEADQSASTRLAVWRWTIDYVQQNPFGGGFNIYLLNKVSYDLDVDENQRELYGVDDSANLGPMKVDDEGRAFHSSYFEMLGEQGYPGLALWLLIHIGGVWRMEILRNRYSNTLKDEETWIAPLANALQNSHIIYLAGALFVGVAFQPFIYILIGMQIGLDTYVTRRSKESKWQPIAKRLLGTEQSIQTIGPKA